MNEANVKDGQVAARTGRWAVPMNLLWLSGPVIASMISRTVMGFVDFVMVSELGTEAQAAMPPASLVLFSIMGLGMGVVSLVNTFVSQALGRQEEHACSAFAWQGVHFSLLFWLAVMPGWFLIEPMFAYIGHEEEVQRLEVAYAQIGLLGIGPAIGVFALSGFFTGIHKPAVPLVCALVGNVMNIVANYALIFGNFGFPAMGVAGAAWATTVTSLLTMLIMLGWMLLPKYATRYGSRITWRPDRRRLWRLCWYGLPAGVHFGVDIVTWTIFTNVFIGQFGKVQLAAHNICVQLMHVSFMPGVGLGTALAVAVGKAIGEKRLDLARSNVRWALLFTTAYMSTIGVLMGVFRFELVGLFTDDMEVVAWGAKIMICCALFQFFDAMNITFTHALRGAGDTHWCAVMVFLGAVVLLMGGSTVAVWKYSQYGSVGPWVVTAVYAMALGLVFAGRYLWGPWERIEMFDHKPPEAV